MREYIDRMDAIKTVAQLYRYESDRMTALQELPTIEVGWIPVSERLPESNGRYIACLGDVCVCELTFEGGKWFNPDTGNEYLDVTAWQPLPEPWKGEE